ncbi:hypothetical protein GZ77_04080 [Endozoicomonas montiporae]|uniref:Uncharacterized protein n=3 Tax=Endozoicomonas montiporae TaxID=1027273 RepID=A0A081NBB6_9GAMM|nr:hypothetical protein EZMO1_1875 [Endozoicomonas montiporae CL-33]KEQ15739.1 hypothetical protein GZ77_04080 [Endozoicomonas montiporae]
MPDASAAIPEDVGTQIIVRNKEGEILATVNLDLKPDYFSFSGKNGYLLEYGIDDSGIHQLTKIHTKPEYVYEDHNYSFPNSNQEETKFNMKVFWATLGGVGVTILIGVMYCAWDSWKKRHNLNP